MSEEKKDYMVQNEEVILQDVAGVQRRWKQSLSIKSLK